ncbi:unnamed protein product, partial [Mesorhabditis belari]|uniref:Anaphase-promoting complex subunit 1 n=1 Tax=Mesorhabditis belari TaxID=2138241 RepID=A0AAF3EN78_9BILA
MGPTLLDVNIDNSVQASAILSLGLLFAQRGTTTFINRLLNEMGKGPHPDSEPSCERYAYVLSIGMAIGLAGLGRGNRHIPQVPFVEAKPGLIERLLIMMEGGPKSRAVFNTDVWTESAFSEEAQAAPSQSNYCKEINDRINIHVTATIAFGLLFMKTHNKTVEFLLRLPNTMPELEKIRADVVPVRVIARALVNWNEIEPTKKWIMEQVPEVVRTHANNAIGLRWPNRIFDAREDDCCDRIVDRETVAQAYIHCIAAACFAVALKFASTTLTEMKELFMEFILMLTPDENQTPAHARLVRLAEKGAVAVSRNLLISALGILMAGSGDVDVFRLCYYLRRSDPVANWYKNSYTHCIQAAIHTTLGFLFLGNARYCFGQSDLAIASLVIAFYPLVGHHAGDHRLYLQPFRFLWVLAVERRLIYAIDADNSKMCRVPLRIHLKAGTSSQSRWVIETTPCLLPPLSGIVEIVIGGSQFEQKMLSQGQIAEILEKQNGCIPVHKARKHVLRQAALLDEEAHRIDAGELEGVEVWQWTPSNQGHDSSTLDWQKMKECLDQARVEPGAFDSRGILTGPVIDLYQNSFKNERLIEKRDVRMAKTFLRNECNPSMLAHFMQRLVDVAESEKSAADAHEPSSSSQEVQPFSPEDLIFNWRYV